MKRRVWYAAAAILLLLVEIGIALYVRDAFWRPFGGDVLVTVLLCCLVRAVILWRMPYLPLWVFLFAAVVEGAQGLGITALIPEGWTVIRIAVGGSFSEWDLVCYAGGCLLFWGTEWLLSWLKMRKI